MEKLVMEHKLIRCLLILFVLVIAAPSMAVTTTVNLSLSKHAYGDLNWHTLMNANLDTIDLAFSPLVIFPSGAGAGAAGQARFRELLANGSNYVGFKAGDVIGANVIWTLPTADGAANTVLSTNGTGTTAWLDVLLATEIDTSAELLAILGDETGTGVAVFGTSPSIATPSIAGATLTGALDAGGATSFEIPNAAAPAVDAEGEIGWETDDEDLHVYDGALDVVIASKTKSHSLVIKFPDVADDFPFWQTTRGIVITGVSAICSGGTNVIGQLQEYAGDGTTPVDVDGDWTITTAEYTDAAFTNAAIDAGDWVGWKTTSVSGAVNFLSLSFEYYEL